MINKSSKYVLYVIAVIGINACKTPYTPAPVTANSNYLVVEGLINITDSTYINLSRTVNISSIDSVKPELKAEINIESNQGGSYPLKELGNGVYAAAPLNLSAANQYRLRIKTANGSQYVSDFDKTVVSPPIDTLTWKATNTALNIYVSTHDPKNSTWYYRWDYTEVWVFHTTFDSQYISNGLTISVRTPAQQIFECYANDKSNLITLGTSIQLSQDVINQALINTIPSNAEKIGLKYTIGVKQYALTKEAYNYWSLLQKNTQQLGSIFDAQPSSTIGNLHNVANPAEVVIGYISAGTISASRIFITKNQLPNWTVTPAYPFSQCAFDSLNCCPPPSVGPTWMPPTTDEFVNFLSKKFTGPLLIPVDSISNATEKGVFASNPLCVDCTLRGSKIPPAYWK
jgi:hypothetical protein